MVFKIMDRALEVKYGASSSKTTSKEDLIVCGSGGSLIDFGAGLVLLSDILER